MHTFSNFILLSVPFFHTVRDFNDKNDLEKIIELMIIENEVQHQLILKLDNTVKLCRGLNLTKKNVRC